MENENLELRRMLCIAWCQCPYLDDGEMSGEIEGVMIDFKRDSVNEIKEKMLLINMNKLARS